MPTTQVTESIRKNWGIIMFITSIITSSLAFYSNVNFRLDENSKLLIALQTETKELRVINKEQEFSIQKLDKESVKIDTKLSNIEATLIEIKQSLKK